VAEDSPQQDKSRKKWAHRNLVPGQLPQQLMNEGYNKEQHYFQKSHKTRRCIMKVSQAVDFHLRYH